MNLEKQAWLGRRSILEMVRASQSGHLGGSLSAIDILTVLYFEVLNVDPAHPDDPARDRFVLSKGHATPALYSTLSARGFIPEADLPRWRQLDSDLSGHAEMTKIPGVEMSTGSLGQGLSAAVGMALAARVDGLGYRVFALLGDGEIQEGQIWEAAMAAGHYKLANLVAFVDNNDLQIDGCVADVLSPYPIGAKFAAFGWQVSEIDGHDLDAIRQAVAAAGADGKPTAIVAKTVKGKGVSFMENVAKWHGSVPDADLFDQAFAEVDSKIGELA
ncbi:MAG: transketolase [Propionibacteriaceae bacterium]|jgi:transketolase|nr:transketolase [Propionibacteriaceae bacterium]